MTWASVWLAAIVLLLTACGPSESDEQRRARLATEQQQQQAVANLTAEVDQLNRQVVGWWVGLFVGAIAAFIAGSHLGKARQKRAGELAPLSGALEDLQKKIVECNGKLATAEHQEQSDRTEALRLENNATIQFRNLRQQEKRT